MLRKESVDYGKVSGAAVNLQLLAIYEGQKLVTKSSCWRVNYLG